MIKLKKLLKEGSPGFTKREFGDPLPTFKDVMEKHQTVNEGWWEDLSDKAQAAYIKKHGAAPNSSTPEPIGKYKKGDITKQVQSDKGREIAKKMAGNMTGAVKKIEKIKKGLSDDPKVKAALRRANESVDKETITEASAKTGWKIHKVYDISDKLWMAMKYDLRDQFGELVKVGVDYGVFQDAQGTAKILKQIKRLMDKI